MQALAQTSASTCFKWFFINYAWIGQPVQAIVLTAFSDSISGAGYNRADAACLPPLSTPAPD
jgi:hypothetical protein